jgi:hypothetical protein
MTPRSLISPLAVALATCAIAPAAALAGPIIDGQAVAAGGGPGVTAKQFQSQNLAAPDQVDRTHTEASKKANVYVPPMPTQSVTPTANPAPTWPSGPQPIATRHAPVTAAPASDDGGLDTGIWLAIGGGALVAAGGLGLAGRKRLQVVRKRQLA